VPNGPLGEDGMPAPAESDGELDRASPEPDCAPVAPDDDIPF